MKELRASLRICVLESVYAEADGPVQFPTYIQPYLNGHSCETHRVAYATARAQVTALIEQGFDVFINLCDGAAGSKSAGIEVVEVLEEHKVAFTGANTAFYEPTRQAMKEACRAEGITVPAYAFVKTEAEARLAADALAFPLIVKPASGYGSVGVLRSSRVEDREALLRECQRVVAKFGEALVEEFIAGREFTVLVAENPADPADPVVYEPIEFRFPAGEQFKHYDLKWIDYQGMSTHRLEQEDLISSLKAMTKKLFLALRGRSYARCDVRMNDAGELFMLEINPNCGIFYTPEDAGSADFILLNDPRGHSGFLELILTSALQDAQLSVRRGAARLQGRTGLTPQPASKAQFAASSESEFGKSR